MDIKFFDDGIVKKFENLVKSNADKKEIGQLYHEIYKRGLAGDPSVIRALKIYQDYLIKDLHSFITELSASAKRHGPEKALKLGYDKTIKTALYEFLDLGGLPDNEIGEIAKDFNMDLNTIATKIVRHKQEAIIYDDIVDVICGTTGLTHIAEQALSVIKNTTPLYDDLEQKDRISTTLDIPKDDKQEDINYYSVDCIFNSNGECQKLNIKLEDSDYPITIDVDSIPHLALSKNDAARTDKNQDER